MKIQYNQEAKSSGDKKSLVVLFFKQHTWEEEQSKSILASKKGSLQLAKEVWRITRTCAALLSCMELSATGRKIIHRDKKQTSILNLLGNEDVLICIMMVIWIWWEFAWARLKLKHIQMWYSLYNFLKDCNLILFI